MVIGCCYMPNGNPQPGPKFSYKLEWFERFHAHALSLLASGHPTVLAGDYNVVPTDADIYSTRSFKDNALLQPAPRAAYQSLLDAGWTDALQRQSPDAPLYTFWSYLRNRWPRDAGLRIDHLLLSPTLARRCAAPASTAPCAVSKARATMRRPGSSSRPNGRKAQPHLPSCLVWAARPPALNPPRSGGVDEAEHRAAAVRRAAMARIVGSR